MLTSSLPDFRGMHAYGIESEALGLESYVF